MKRNGYYGVDGKFHPKYEKSRDANPLAPKSPIKKSLPVLDVRNRVNHVGHGHQADRAVSSHSDHGHFEYRNQPSARLVAVVLVIIYVLFCFAFSFLRFV